MRRRQLLAIALLLLPHAASAGAEKEGARPVRSRTFDFTYEVSVADLGLGETARLWLPVPSNSAEQTVQIIKQEASPTAKIGTEAKYGNRILYDEIKRGETVRMVYRVKRLELTGSAKLAADEAEKFLKPDARVPAEGKFLKLTDGKKLPEDRIELGRALYDIVNAELRYSKEGTGWGNGDVEWVCDSKYGNCSDFHSLFIALARSKKMPGRFEIGFALPEQARSGEIAGYHCWAKFAPNAGGWVAVDISEANKDPKRKDYYFGNLTPDRVTFSVGRDLTLTPKQDGPPLNFLVYPYAELNGKPLPAERIKRRFVFEDVKGE